MRLAYIDALRGVASLWVVLFHIATVGIFFQPALQHHFHPVFLQFLNAGNSGVQIFFVLSGFVIATVFSIKSGLKDCLFFTARRQTRLTPPYWVALGLILTIPAVVALASHDHSQVAKFSTVDVVKNAFYLQYLFPCKPVLGPAWTLCLEVQFYAFIAVTMAIACAFKSIDKKQLFFDCTVLVAGLIGLVNLHYWPTAYSLFAVGYLVAAEKKSSRKLLLCDLLLVLLLTQSMVLVNVGNIVGGLTALSLRIANAAQLQNWLNKPAFLYFGRISYSLYLVNINVVATIYKVAHKVGPENALVTYAAAAGSVVASIIAADLMYRFVESPSIALSKRFRAKKIQSSFTVSQLQSEPVSASFEEKSTALTR